MDIICAIIILMTFSLTVSMLIGFVIPKCTQKGFAITHGIMALIIFGYLILS